MIQRIAPLQLIFWLVTHWGEDIDINISCTKKADHHDRDILSPSHTLNICVLSMGIPMRQQVEEYINNLQEDVVLAFERLGPNAPPFKRDSWLRSQGGVGKSCVFASPIAEDTTISSSTSHSIHPRKGRSQYLCRSWYPSTTRDQTDARRPYIDASS